MIIYKALKNSYVSQGWGENLAQVLVDANGIPYRPFRVVGTKGPNTKPFYPAIGLDGHPGSDVATYNKAPFYFPIISECPEWIALDGSDADGGIGDDIYSTTRITIVCC